MLILIAEKVIGMIKIHETAYIASSAIIIGNVTIGKQCGVYPYAVIRGDENQIMIDDGSNVQDCCVLHVDHDHDMHIGKNVSIGHGAVVHGATIEDTCLIGIHATILNGAHIGKGSMIGAGALVTTDMQIPEYSLVLGIPGKVVKQDKTFSTQIELNAKIYRELSEKHKKNAYEIYTP